MILAASLRAFTRTHQRLVVVVSAAVVAVTGVACISLVVAHQHHAPTASSIAAAAVGEVDTDPVTATSGLLMSRSLPTSVTIPSINVKSALLTLGQNPDGSMQVPAPGPHYGQAGWYRYSPTPGELGPAVIVGHVDSTSDGPSVFFRLGSLHRGDLIQVARADNTTAVFTVDSVHLYLKTEFPTQLVYGNTTNSALRVITCGGPFNQATGHYQDNVVVFASLARTA